MLRNTGRSVVFNLNMSKRFRAILLGVVAAPLVIAAPAQALITEIGNVTTLPAPSCPGVNCTAITRTTGIQTEVAGVRRPYASPVSGRVVAFTLKLGAPTKTEQTFFNTRAGGGPEAQVAVFRGNHPSKTLLQTIAVSPVFQLAPWFGQTVEFPLINSLPIRKGDDIALTVPTWAPALAVNQATTTAWRASRHKCTTASVFLQTSQQIAGALARFGCSFTTAQLTFTATVISTP